MLLVLHCLELRVGESERANKQHHGIVSLLSFDTSVPVQIAEWRKHQFFANPKLPEIQGFN